MSEHVTQSAESGGVTFAERERGNDERCGTTAGAVRHSNRGEKPCPACAEAKAEYDRRWRSAPEVTRRNRLHAKCQRQAMKALMDAHPEEYRAAYLAAKVELFADPVTSPGVPQ